MDKKAMEILKNPLYNFKRGDEEKVAKYLQYYVDEHLDHSREWYQIDDDIITLEQIFYNSKDNYDYKKLWKYLNKSIFCIDTKNIIESIIYRIDYLSFREEMYKLDDCVLAYNYYITYGRTHNIACSEIIELYLLYLKKKFESNSLKKEEVFWKFFQLLITSYDSYSYSGRSARESFNKITFDKEKEYLKNNGNKRIRKRVEASTPMLTIVDYLLSKINLNEEIEFDKEKVAIEDAIAGTLINPSISDTYGGRLLIKDFLKVTPSIVFNTRQTYTTALELNALIDNVEGIKRIIRRKSVDLYQGNDYSSLKKTIMMRGYPKDLLSASLLSDKFAHQDLLEVLLCKKVKMLDVELIYNALTKDYLTQEEYEKLLSHIEEKGVIVYQRTSNGVTFSIANVDGYIIRKIATDEVMKK